MTAKPICFIDTETTHLDRDIRRAWEIAIIRRDPATGHDTEHTWFINGGALDLGHADPMALKIGRFYERHPAFRPDADAWLADDEDDVAEQIEALTRGATLAGAVTSFDEHTLDRMLRRNGLCPSWHHRLIDVRVYAAGVAGADPDWAFPEALAAFGLAEDDATRHTALGDARLARDLYDAARQVATTRFQDTQDQIGRLADLLTDTANALKGEPDPLQMHDWSDLPTVAAAVVAERDAALDRLRSQGIADAA